MQNIEKPIESYLRDYRRAQTALSVAVQSRYPIGAPVRLKHGVLATVHAHRLDAPGIVDLMLDDGRVWTTSVDQIERV